MPIKVVIADDEPVILRGLRKIIDWPGLTAEIAGEALDGNQAECLLDEVRPHLLLSDICMPGKTGIELLKHINYHQYPTKVIFFSGYQEFSYVKDAISYGALDYILKPIDKNQLEQSVRKAILLVKHELDETLIRDRLLSLQNKLAGAGREQVLELQRRQDELIQAVFQLNPVEVEERLTEVGRFIDELAVNDREATVNQYLALLHLIDQEIRSVGIDSSAVLDPSGLLARDAPADLQAWLGDALRQVQQMIVANLKAKQSGKMPIILEYIDTHYAEQITLQSISRMACMNPNYFSVIFKKYTDTNFKDYLTKVRMECALRLLLSTDLLVYEIAERVGFNDAKYFGDAFKKYYGKNPLEYRRDALRGGV